MEGEGNADLKKIRELVDKVKQSHTVYDLLYLEQSHFGVPVRYAESVRFQTSFYPRYNLPQLKLDNKWKLNGGRKLSGYNSQETVDFYPVSVRLRMGPAEVSPKEKTRIYLSCGAEIEGGVKMRSTTTIRTSAADETASEERVGIRASASQAMGVGDITIYNKNLLSGGWKLNGGRKLNGGTETR